jgi:hypothetical protein
MQNKQRRHDHSAALKLDACKDRPKSTPLLLKRAMPALKLGFTNNIQTRREANDDNVSYPFCQNSSGVSSELGDSLSCCLSDFFSASLIS